MHKKAQWSPIKSEDDTMSVSTPMPIAMEDKESNDTEITIDMRQKELQLTRDRGMSIDKMKKQEFFDKYLVEPKVLGQGLVCIVSVCVCFFFCFFV